MGLSQLQEGPSATLRQELGPSALPSLGAVWRPQAWGRGAALPTLPPRVGGGGVSVRL